MVNENLKIGIIEDQKEFTQYIINHLQEIKNIEKIYKFESAEHYWREEKGKLLDVLLMDIRLPGMNGVELTSHVKSRNPDMKILIISANFSDDLIFQALKNGAIGYVLKSEIDNLPNYIEILRGGGGVMSPTIAIRVAMWFQKTPSIQVVLSFREQQILEAISNGASAKSVAQRLAISESTVRTHIRSIYEKLQVNSRAGLIKKAGDMGLL